MNAILSAFEQILLWCPVSLWYKEQKGSTGETDPGSRNSSLGYADQRGVSQDALPCYGNVPQFSAPTERLLNICRSLSPLLAPPPFPPQQWDGEENWRQATTLSLLCSPTKDNK